MSFCTCNFESAFRQAPALIHISTLPPIEQNFFNQPTSVTCLSYSTKRTLITIMQPKPNPPALRILLRIKTHHKVSHYSMMDFSVITSYLNITNSCLFYSPNKQARFLTAQSKKHPFLQFRSFFPALIGGKLRRLKVPKQTSLTLIQANQFSINLNSRLRLRDLCSTGRSYVILKSVSISKSCRQSRL